jgi:L-alanine-DL-glutamate epimerase-like enolase superfamily enzyme
MHLSVEDTVAQTTQNVSRASSPSDLRITDLRVAEKGFGSLPNRIIRIDTNQGISGLGDIRDGTDQRFALFLKSKIVGLNPCNVEMLFKIIRQFGGHGRMGGGVSAVEMACWDICGKALGVPVWQLLGGRYRDRVRCYADTPQSRNPQEQIARLRERLEVHKFTWLKMDLGIHQLGERQADGLVNYKYWNANGGGLSRNRVPDVTDGGYMNYWNTDHQFTQIQLTDKGLEGLQKVVEDVRNIVGTEIPLSTDHYGYMDNNQMIRLGRVLEKYRLAWLEDTIPWYNYEQIKEIKNALETPICTGEDIYLLANSYKGGFKGMIDAQAVDIIHPDLVSAGGILETKKITDYAEEAGIPTAFHANSTPVAWMANVHCAAASEGFLVLEHHNTDNPNWERMVKITGSKPLFTEGFANVPLDAPGLGIELNDDTIKEMMNDKTKYFEPTPEWDNPGRTYDKLWI